MSNTDGSISTKETASTTKSNKNKLYEENEVNNYYIVRIHTGKR